MDSKKVALVTWYNDKCKSYGEITDISKRVYCQRHGYSYFKHSERTVPERHPYWEKPNALLSHLDDAEYLVWLDADVIIANLDFDIINLFDVNDPNKVIYMSKDWNGWNNGVFCVRSCDIGKSFLEDVNNDKNYNIYKNHRWPEQECMGFLMSDKYKDYVKELPIKQWNSYGANRRNTYSDGDFIMHMPGSRENIRIRDFNKINIKNKLYKNPINM